MKTVCNIQKQIKHEVLWSLFDMNTLQRFKQAPSTVAEAKLNIFSPFEKEKAEQLNCIVFESDNFIVTLDGYKLNQIHRDILDIALYYGDSSFDGRTADIRPLRIFSLYDIQKHLNYKAKRNNKWIEKKFAEMQKSIIKIESKKTGDWTQFNIIEVAQYSKKQNRYAIILSETYTFFFENEISINYKPYLCDMLLLNAQSRALSRYILSHSNNFHIDLEKLMSKIGICKNTISRQAFDKNKNKILEEKEKLEKLNIFLIKKSNDNRKKDYLVEYKILPKIQVFHPKIEN